MKFLYDHRAVAKAIKKAGGVAAVERRSKICHQALSYYARGMVTPGADKLGRLAGALGVSPRRFYILER